MASIITAADVISNGAFIRGRWNAENARNAFTVHRTGRLIPPFQPFSDLDYTAIAILLILCQDELDVSNEAIQDFCHIERWTLFRIKLHIKNAEGNSFLPGGRCEGGQLLISADVLREAYDLITQRGMDIKAFKDAAIKELLACAIAKSQGHNSYSVQDVQDLSRMTIWRYQRRLIEMGAIHVEKGETKNESRVEAYNNIRNALSQCAALRSVEKRGARLDRDYYSSDEVSLCLGNRGEKPELWITKEANDFLDSNNTGA